MIAATGTAATETAATGAGAAGATGPTVQMTCREAANRAVAEALAADPTVWALGEDLGRGGVFKQYTGLQERFGPERVVDTPISEATIMGAAVGAALVGTRPIVEMRFSDFALCAIDELVNQAAKARYMFGGRGRVPITVRMPIGLWRSSAAQHSQSLEAWFAHIPGLVVACPATPADVLGLLLSAVRSDDPVVVMEHKDLWDLSGPVPAPRRDVGQDGGPDAGQDAAVPLGQDAAVPLGQDAAVPLGRAETVRAGHDVTVVTWSKLRHTALAAADLAAARGVAAEVIDLRTLYPWDMTAVLDSVRRTRRLLVVHEAVAVGGFGGEVAATVAEQCHGVLAAPVRRLGAPRAPVPYARELETRVEITAERIAAAVIELAGIELAGIG